MRRIASGAFAALMGLTIASSASASTLNITNIIGDWIALSVVPPGGAAIVNVAGQGTDRIRWPAAGGQRRRLHAVGRHHRRGRQHAVRPRHVRSPQLPDIGDDY